VETYDVLLKISGTGTSLSVKELCNSASIGEDMTQVLVPYILTTAQYCIIGL